MVGVGMGSSPPTLSGPGLPELPLVFMNKVLLLCGHSHGFTMSMAALAL